VRDGLVVVYVLRNATSSPAIDGFKKEFTGWIRQASPNHEVKEVELGDGTDRKRLMATAEPILKGGGMPACPPETASATPENQRARALCPPFYAGVIVVEFDSKAPGGRQVTASWRIREEGTKLNEKDDWPARAIALPRRDLEADGKLVAQDFALAAFIEGAIDKQLKNVLDRMLDVDPELRERWLRGTKECKTCPDCVTCPAPPPPPPTLEGAWPHAFLFAGSPYLEDRSATKLSSVAFSAVDVAGVVGTVTLFGLSIDARNKYSDNNDVGELDRANDLRRAAVITAAGVLMYRGAVAACYAIPRCRTWTRAW
jgi:hypothetical protein